MSNGVKKKKKTEFKEFRNNEKSAYKFYIYIYICVAQKEQEKTRWEIV
jgi:hypothetical protein